ncbi:MAG TPA: hypothetical protein VGO46_11570 [Gemmatimonadaceae bacterium]|nr:hypothetical protein [Gemmatimonadaceae bacterium]
MLSTSIFHRIRACQHDKALTIAPPLPSLARMIRTRIAFGVILILSSAGGCRQARAADLGMPDTTFVATLNELRRIETDTALDLTMRDSTRRMILRRHKVTSTQLEKAARILAQSPARASDLWRQIESVPRPAVPKANPGGAAPGNNHPVTH